MTLRPYQSAALEAVSESWRRGARRVLVVLPTGTGKTVVFAEGAKRCRGPVLVLAHRRELVRQAAEKLEKWAGEPVAIEMGDERDLSKPSEGEQSRIVAASVQSLQTRLNEIPRDRFSLIVIDEAHHSTAQSYQDILGHFSRAFVLGVTATPDRSDKVGLGKVFDTCAYEMGIQEAIRGGWLAPLSSFVVRTGADFSKVRRSKGDFKAGDLDKAMNNEPTLRQVATPLVERRGDRPTIVFCVSVAHAYAMAEKLCEISNDPDFARALDGTSSDGFREQTLADFQAGRIQVLCNCSLFTEGWDCPPVALVAIARPTSSRALYAQMIGRGTRLSPETGKTDCMVLDFLPKHSKHALATAVDLIGEEIPEDLAAMLDRMMGREDYGEGQVVSGKDLLEEAKALLDAERDSDRYDLIRRDPFAAIDIFDLDEVGALDVMASEAQKNALEKWGLTPKQAAKLSLRQASRVIQTLVNRKNAGLCTLKQAKLLAKQGIDPREITFEVASQVINEIAERKWQVTDALKAEWAGQGIPMAPVGANS